MYCLFAWKKGSVDKKKRGGGTERHCQVPSVDHPQPFKHTVQPLPKVKSLTNFFVGTSSSSGLIFHMWEEKGLKFDLALKETEFFSFMRSLEKREQSHRKISREMMSQELLTQEARVSCRLRVRRRHPDRARGHAEATVTGRQLFALRAAESPLNGVGVP